MVPVSVVIITKNEAEIIARSVAMAMRLTDDIVIVDNSSTDNTARIAESYGCRVFNESWNGYGANKNKGIKQARYNWILSIDADEIIDEQLIAAIQAIDFNKADIIYDIRFKTYFGQKLIRFGSWGRDHHLRLFNRGNVCWSELPVHETLIFPKNTIRKALSGYIHHYSVKDEYECREKATYYASLSAKKYYAAGKSSNMLKMHFAPAFNFVRNYFFYLGFLDGAEGWYIACNTAKNTWLKYHYLYNLETTDTKKHYIKQNTWQAYFAE